MENKSGDIVIRKAVLGFIVLLIALISSFSTIVAYAVTMKGDIEHVKAEVEQSTEQYVQLEKKMDDKLYSYQNEIIRNQEQIISMSEDIREIKTDVKELIKK